MSSPREQELLAAILREIRGGGEQSRIEFRAFSHKLHEVLCELEEIREELQPQRLTRSVANVFSGDILMANNVLVFNVGDTSVDTLTPFLADGVTPSGGAVSNVVVTFSDPSATAEVQPDNTILFTGVADSGGLAVSGSTSLTITDTDGVVSTWNVPFTVQTSAVVVPPQQLTQSVANVFSTPASSSAPQGTAAHVAANLQNK
jgi:hypothetical protein